MHDTTYSKVVIYQFDTIYRTVSFQTAYIPDAIAKELSFLVTGWQVLVQKNHLTNQVKGPAARNICSP